MNEFFEIMIFTASEKLYADKVIDYIDTENFCCDRLYRNDCFGGEEKKIKDLHILNR